MCIIPLAPNPKKLCTSPTFFYEHRCVYSVIAFVNKFMNTILYSLIAFANKERISTHLKMASLKHGQSPLILDTQTFNFAQRQTCVW